ncbi:MAG: hypothetical protein FWD57_03365 [Polyangiaceae bacterium]|nr:hypothetical protein [Polyangiaceae bacterium]
MIAPVKLFGLLWARLGEGTVGLPISGWAAGVAVVLVAIVALLRWPTRFDRFRKPARWVALAAICTVALAWAWEYRWLADDAYISFRYARNFAAGDGLVYNPGQPVEGYTSFLWTVLLIPAALIKLPIGLTSLVLGLVSMIAALVLTARLATLLSPRRGRAVVPIAALLLASNYTFASFGTSGLETMFATALVLLSLERALRGRPMQSGFAGILATMTHPAHGLFYLALGCAAFLQGRCFRNVFRYSIPFLALYIPYYLARWWYYGSFFPNTYYAKLQGETYFSQGELYVLICIMACGIIWWLPMLIWSLHSQRRKLFGRFLLIAAPAYLLYIIWVGGDPMLGRLFVPLLPLCALAIEIRLRHLAASRRTAVAMIGVAITALSAFHVRLIRDGERYHRVSDERTNSSIESLSPLRTASESGKWSNQLISLFGKGFSGPMLGTANPAVVGFRTRFPIFDANGVTDPDITRRPVHMRFRPDNEKLASGSEVYASGAVISDLGVYPDEYDKFVERLPGLPMRLIRYQDDVVRKLRKISDEGTVPAPRFIGSYRAPTDNPSRFSCDLWFFEAYYFAHQPPETRTEFIRSLDKQGAISKIERLFYSQPDHTTPEAWTRVSADFFRADTQSWLRRGNAFHGFPSTGAAGWQSAIVGHVDTLLVNTFLEKGGDSATGLLQSHAFRLEGDVITLRVGGGMLPDKVHVALIVDGHEVARATGCGSEILGRRIWDVKKHVGKEARLLFVDQSTDSWGHLVVSDIEVWRTGS